MRKLNVAFVLLLLSCLFAANVFAQNSQDAQFSAALTAGGTLNDRGNAIITFGSGPTSPIYVAGEFAGTADFDGTMLTSPGGTDAFIACYNRSGFIDWIIQGIGFEDNSATALATDPSGNLYVAGTFRSARLDIKGTLLDNANPIQGTSDVFLAKIDPAGVVLWAVAGGGAEDDEVGGLAVDKFGQIYLTGSFRGDADFSGQGVFSFGGQDIFLARYDKDGNLIWVETSGGDGDDSGRDVVVDAFGSVFVAGNFRSDVAYFAFLEVYNTENLNNSDIFIASYDSLALPQWASRAGGTGFESVNAITMDTTLYHLYLTGSFDNTAIFGTETLFNQVPRGRSSFVAKMDDAGNHFWARQSQGRLVIPTDIALDTFSNALITGYFGGNAEFECTTLAEAYTDPDSLGNATDVFLAKYSNSGELMAASRGGVADLADEGRGIFVDPLNDAFTTGYFSDTATFNDLELQSAGLNDVYLAIIDFVDNVCGIPSQAGRVYGDTTAYCLIDTASITVSGYRGEVQAWQYSYDAGKTWTTIETFDNVLETTDLTIDTTLYRAIVQNCTCGPDTSAAFTKIVNTATVAGNLFIPGPDTVCATGNSGEVRLQNAKGRIVSWDISYDNFNTVAFTFPQLDPTDYALPFTDLVGQDPNYQAVFFRAAVMNGVCDTVLSNVVIVKLDSCFACGLTDAKGGNLTTPEDTVCFSGNQGFLSLRNQIGEVVLWEVSNDNFNDPSKITFFPPPPIPTEFGFFNLEQTTWFRARVFKPGCGFEVSESFRVYVDSCEFCGFPPTVAGTVTGGDTVCFINNAGVLRAQGYSGDVVRWEVSYSQFIQPTDTLPNNTVWIPIAQPFDTLEYKTLVRTAWYRAVIRSFGCKEAFTPPVQLLLKGCIPCVAPNAPLVNTLTDTSGLVSWTQRPIVLDYELEYRMVGDPFWFRVTGIRRPPFRIGSLQPATQYEVRVRTRCADDNISAFSPVTRFRTSCTSGGAAISNLTQGCAGNNNGSISLTGSNGRVLVWEYSTDNFFNTQIFDINTPTLPFSNLTKTTSFRAILQDGNCTPVRSSSVTVTVVPCPTDCPRPEFILTDNVNAVSALALWIPLNQAGAKYELSYKSVQAASWITINNIVPSSIQLTGLTPGTQYRMRLRNICEEGTYSDYSDEHRFETPASVDICQTPVINSRQVEITTATFTWAPVDGALGYQFRYRRALVGGWVTTDLQPNFITIRNLSPNVRYVFELRAWCGDKFSPWSKGENFTSQPFPCYVPKNVFVSGITSSTANISWDASPHAVSYDVRLKNLATQEETVQRATGLSFTATGMQTNGVYTVEVRSNCGTNVFSGYSSPKLFQVSQNRESTAGSDLESLSIYPNPNEGRFTVDLGSNSDNQAGIVTLTVSDLTGRRLMTRSVDPTTDGTSIALELLDVSAGVYILTVERNNARHSARLIVK